MKRRPTIVKIVDRNIADAHHVVSAPVASVPRVVPVTRTARQPADVTETKSESNAHSEPAASPSEERNVRWRPDWVVSGIHPHRPWPPRPARAIGQPAPVVIWRPSLRLI